MFFMQQGLYGAHGTVVVLKAAPCQEPTLLMHGVPDYGEDIYSLSSITCHLDEATGYLIPAGHSVKEGL